MFEAVTMQLKAKAVTLKTGTLVDATIIASASEGDDDARWVKHKVKRAVHGFMARSPGIKAAANPISAAIALMEGKIPPG